MWNAIKSVLEVRPSDYGIAFDFPINYVLLGLWLGVCIAVIAGSAIRYDRRRIVLVLLRNKAIGEENALRLRSLRLENDRRARATLRNAGGEFARMVGSVPIAIPTHSEYVAAMDGKDPEAARKRSARADVARNSYYLRREFFQRAKTIVGRKPPSVIGCAIAVLIVSAVFAAVIFLMPNILGLLSNLR